MQSIMEKLSEKVNRVSGFILIVFFIIAFMAAVYQVFSRFVLQNPLMKKALPMIDFSIFNLTWIEEFIRYLFVWIVFLGIGIIYKHKGHAQVEILHHYLSEYWKNKLLIVIEVVNSALFLFLIFYGWSILKFTSQQISPSIGLNMTFIYGAVLVSSLICLLHSSVHLLELGPAKSRRDEVVRMEMEAAREHPNLG